MSSDNKPGGMLGNLKFNTVGREEAAREVLAPQIDGATKVRNAIFVLVALIALGGIVYVGFKETGKDIFAPPSNTHNFEAPQPTNVN